VGDLGSIYNFVYVKKCLRSYTPLIRSAFTQKVELGDVTSGGVYEGYTSGETVDASIELRCMCHEHSRYNVMS